MRTLPNERLTASPKGDQPERKCILSGMADARDSLIRLAISPEGDVLPDALARAPGRGAWIGVSRREFEAAQGNGQLRGALARSFKGGALNVPDDLPERIETALLRAFSDRLGLELRAGHLQLGSDRIAENARSGLVEWLGHAADAAEDGARKLDQAWRVGTGQEGSGLAGTRLALDRAALSVALGRDNVVHLAVIDAAAAQRVAIPLQRLERFRGRVATTGTEDSDRTGQSPGAAGHDGEEHRLKSESTQV